MSQTKKNPVPVFRQMSISLPAYKKFLKEKKVRPEKVTDLESFKRLVPIISKKDVFCSDSLGKWLNGNQSNTSNIMASSGFSGKSSYGFSSQIEEKANAVAIKAVLNKTIGLSKKTLAVCCLSMGVQAKTGLPTISVGPRVDLAVSFIKASLHEFDQFIVFADVLLGKNFVEESRKQNLPWKKMKIHVVCGGDSFSNSFREYLHDIMDTGLKTMEKRGVFASFGMTELGLSIFFESTNSVSLRNKLQKNASLREKLLETVVPYAPAIMHYNPASFFVEIVGKNKNGFGEIVVSHLESRKLQPFVRYNTKDLGKILAGKGIPSIAILGRKSITGLSPHGLSVNAVKEALYRNKKIADTVTGFFQIQNLKKPVVLVQLKPGTKQTGKIETLIAGELADLLGNRQFKVKAMNFFECPQFLQNDFDHKIKYLKKQY